MGNYIEKSLSRANSDDEGCEKPKGPNELSPCISLNEDEDGAISDSINFHIYSYKQQMQHKEQQILKWAMAKLALTDELIRANVQRNFPSDDYSADYETDGYLTDDEMDNSADQELCNLESYRTKLIDIIVLLKRTNLRKKGKRSKRRKTSSKCNIFANKCNGLGLKR